MSSKNQPHGKRLIDRNLQTKKNSSGMYSISIGFDLRNDIENIADGVFSPLEGFVGQEDFQSIVSTGRLKNNLPWTIPLVLDVDITTAEKMKDSGEVLFLFNERPFGIIKVEEVYGFDKLRTARMVYKTEDQKHPGVKKVFDMKPNLVGGKINLYEKLPTTNVRAHRKTPLETRKIISSMGWKTVAGFQTRNVPHIAHEMLQKAALNVFDGLFINPLIGRKKGGDFKDEVILSSYETLISNYYPQNRILFSTLHTEMRYAGPREAIHHAIMRKNFGCTHFIVGRDHAGVGNYYPPFAAHEIFKEYPDLEIEPIFFPEFYYCKKCLSYANEKNCPHESQYREVLSGTKMRKMVSQGEIPPPHLMRPEIAEIIVSFKDPFIPQ